MVEKIEKNENNKDNYIDVEDLLDNFRVKNLQNFPFYIKSIWKDLSRRSESPDKGFCKVIFSNYYELPGYISIRLFNLMDKDKDGFLSYNEFSRGMTNLFCTNINDFLKFIFDFFDENGYEKINPENVRAVFQYIPLQNKEVSFQDRIESQEELHDIISNFFNNKENMDFNDFKKYTTKRNSTIFLYLAVYLLSKKPFQEKLLNFYHNNEPSEKSQPLHEDRKPVLMASPNLTSKYSPGVQILNSPIMANEKEKLKRKIGDNYITRLTGTNKNSKSPVSVKSGNSHTNESTTEITNLELLHPSRMKIRLTNNENDKEDNKSNIEQEMWTSLQNINNEDVTYEGYLIKLVEDKLKKLWFTLHNKYLYCKYFL
jgi:Ca2+-binding EF-hand superfamily protein